MQRYKIQLKVPSSNHKIWAGPEHQVGILPTVENDRQKTKRETLEHRLKTLVGEENVTWNKRGYFYTATLTEEQAAEVSKWDLVRTVIPSK